MDVNPNEALAILKKSIEFNPNNRGSVWKMMRFQLYLWVRLEEDKQGYLPKKAETVRKLVHSNKYKKYYDKFNTEIKFPTRHLSSRASRLRTSPQNWFRFEFLRLNHLITDPRQSVFFKSKYFKYENSNKPIPQRIIDRVK